jgi:hypothetical protein
LDCVVRLGVDDLAACAIADVPVADTLVVDAWVVVVLFVDFVFGDGFGVACRRNLKMFHVEHFAKNVTVSGFEACFAAYLNVRFVENLDLA